MNILLIANELRYTCGVTNHILHLSRGLAENQTNNNFILSGGGNGADRFSDIDASVTIDSRFLHENRTTAKYLSAIRMLTKFIKDNKIDIVHSHSHYAANIAANAARLKKKATIQTNHGILEEKGKLKHFNAHKYVAINEHIFNYMIENQIASKGNIAFIRCGIPIPESPPLKPAGKITIAAASRFVHEKGLDTFLKAVGLLDTEVRSKAEFIIAGEGPLEGELKSLNELENAGIIFAGAVKDINGVLGTAHILVYPSHSHSEGFPAVITEAGANNCLVISSDFFGVDSVIKSGTDGLLFKQQNFEELAKILERVIKNFDEFKPIADSFHNKVNELFRIDTMISKHEELYKNCL